MEPVAIRAVAFDIGGVLEVVDDAMFPAPAERRLCLAEGSVGRGTAYDLTTRRLGVEPSEVLFPDSSIAEMERIIRG